MRYILIVCAGLLVAFDAEANFGFGPCCSGATCGVIPCDTGCAGSAFDSFASTFSNSVSSISQSYGQVNQKLSEINSASTSLFNSLIESHNDSTDQLTDSFDSFSKSLSSEVVKQMKVCTDSIGARESALTLVLKALAKANVSKRVNEEVSEQTYTHFLGFIAPLDLDKFLLTVNETQRLKQLSFQRFEAQDLTKSNFDDGLALLKSFEKLLEGRPINSNEIALMRSWMLTNKRTPEFIDRTIKLALLDAEGGAGYELGRNHSQFSLMSNEFLQSLQHAGDGRLQKETSLIKQLALSQFHALNKIAELVDE